MNFSLKDNKNQPLKNLSVRLVLIDTYFGDQTKDKIILTKEIITDVNGDFEFDYTFPKQNYFDVELNFADPVTHEDLNTGYLVQPRSLVKDKILDGLILVGSLTIGYWLGSRYTSK
jgi:hypothetical protein